MATNWSEALELAPQHSYPEVYYPPTTQPSIHRRDHSIAGSVKPLPYKPFNDDRGPTTVVVDVPQSIYSRSNSVRHFGEDPRGFVVDNSRNNYDAQSVRDILPPAEEQSPRKLERRVCGCSLLVLILSIIIAVLAIAVIGLATGTSIQTQRANSAESRANDAEMKVAALPAPVSLDRGCFENPEAVTATRYTSDFFDRSTYKIFCNNDAPNPPLQSLFVANFNDCMDACTAYSSYTRGNFPSARNASLTMCNGVSFITSWTNRTNALKANAPGNCYLKPGPQTSKGLTRSGSNDPDAAVHAAILDS